MRDRSAFAVSVGVRFAVEPAPVAISGTKRSVTHRQQDERNADKRVELKPSHSFSLPRMALAKKCKPKPTENQQRLRKT